MVGGTGARVGGVEVRAGTVLQVLVAPEENFIILALQSSDGN